MTYINLVLLTLIIPREMATVTIAHIVLKIHHFLQPSAFN